MPNSTVFIDKQTIIPTAWANEVNNYVYGIYVNAANFGLMAGGTTDNGPAIRAAVAAITTVTTNGGTVLIPPGSYLVNPDPSDTTNTAITVPSNVRIMGTGQVATTLIPGTNNTVVFRVIGTNGGINDLAIYNSLSCTGTSGIRLAPPNESDTTTHSDIEFNRFMNLSIKGLTEGIVLKPGPTVSAQDSYCYYNTFINVDARGCTRSFWLTNPSTTTTSNGPNRNTFIACRGGQSGSNTGLQIDNGNTCSFISCAFEGIQTGSTPNATPTAVFIAPSTASSNTDNTYFTDFNIEAASRDVNNSNNTTIFNGWFHTGSYYSPNGVLPAVDIQAAQTHFNNIIADSSLAVNKASASQILDVGFTSNGQGVSFADQGSHANNFFSWNGSIGGGPSGLIEFLYGGSSVFTWGGASSAYAGVMRINNPVGHPLILGTNNTDRVEIDSSGNMFPVQDNTNTLGAASNRWSVVYAATGSINTSDERDKQQVSNIDDKVLKAWSKVNYTQYKFNDAVEKKQDGARWHFGLIAQKVKAAFESEGLDPFSYGILCHDTWDTGEKYGIRYEEALALECAYLRSLIKK